MQPKFNYLMPNVFVLLDLLQNIGMLEKRERDIRVHAFQNNQKIDQNHSTNIQTSNIMDDNANKQTNK